MKNMQLGTKLALLILLGMAVLAYTAAWNDTMITDEDPHIAAGIGYVQKADMRLNPEHPPLVKVLAALPVTLIPDLNVPYDHPYWANPDADPNLVNGQWEFGQTFIFDSGNDADLIVRLARLGPMLLMLLLGWFVYRWTRDRVGVGGGLLALFLYATAPALLAHGILVTTDVPAALGIFAATYFYLLYLKDPTRKTLLWAGIAFGLAQLLKFSVVLLVPYFGILAFAWWWLQVMAQRGADKRSVTTALPVRPFLAHVGGTMIVGLIGVAVIYVVYALIATAGYPADRQLADTMVLVSRFPESGKSAGDLVVAMAKVPVLRPLAQYLLGLFMVLQRAAGGNTTFFMGQVARDAWLSYFPMLYLTKVRLAVHLLSLMALVSGFLAIRRELFTKIVRSGKSLIARVAAFAQEHFDELAMILFILIYWASTLLSNLNIGIRHLSPTMPFVFALIAIGLKPLLLGEADANAHSMLHRLFGAAQNAFIVTILVIWALISGLIPFPHYLGSFNALAELRGGGENIAVDSNLDWGQDLKRLGEYVEEQQIESITINYFGWALPKYYMPEGTQINGWWADWDGQPEGWFAVSATFMRQACAEPVRGFGDREGDNYDGYCFLNDYAPEAIIGTSIYVYNLPTAK